MKKTLTFLLLICIPFITLANERSLYIKKYKNESKTALVIGNANYTHFSKLKNSKNDAYDMQKSLRKLGFDTLYLENGTLRDMKKIVRKFSKKLKNGGVGFFYYAGHGIEVDGQNYLIPTKAEIPEKNEVEYEALSVNMIIDKMEDSGNRLNIVVLDACRNDPFSRSGSGGLAQINNAKGMYIAYATAPGNVASDGSGRNGLFTKHLLENINKPNLKLNEVFANTRASVYDASNDKQLPWTSSSVIGDFYFKLDGNIKYQQPKKQKSISLKEETFWEVVKEEDSKDYYELYLKKFPNGFYVDLARLKVESKNSSNYSKTDSSNKVWVDNDTGLMWQNEKYDSTDKYYYEKNQKGGKVGWQSDAIKYCNNLKLSGYSDWRLPSIDELKSIANIQLCDIRAGCNNKKSKEFKKENEYRQNKSKDGYGFFIKKTLVDNMPLANGKYQFASFHSSTIYPKKEINSYYINFTRGFILQNGSNDNNYIRCVREN